MSDPQIFGTGVFVSLWLVSFFVFSAYELRKGYQNTGPRTEDAEDPSREGLAVTRMRRQKY